MLNKLVDTNIFIDRFGDPERYKDVFLSDGFVCLSAVVLMELKAGAHTPAALKAVHELAEFFRRVDRVILPSIKDYDQAGEIISKLQAKKGYEIKKCASITNDALIAASARSRGAVVYTQNKKDFQAIREVFEFKVSFV
ncbi:MAG: type II toxin-antitoxin system VapC family toxin [Nitrospirota bacterium]